MSGRGKLGGDMRDIWSMQPRFEKRTGSSPYSMLEQPRFRAGFDFLRLRAQTGEIDIELAEWWEKFSTAYDDERHAMIEAVRHEQMQRPQQARTRVRGMSAVAPVGTDPAAARLAQQSTGDLAGFTEGGLTEAGDATAPRKRRRRRKPQGERGAAPDAPTGLFEPPASGDASGR